MKYSHNLKKWLLLVALILNSMDPKLSFIQNLIGKVQALGKETYVREQPPAPKDRYIRNATTTGEFTMYNPSVHQTDDRPHEMASGRKIYEGAIASGDRNLPFGTKVYIPQLDKTYIVEDRMNKRYDSATTSYFDIPTVTATGSDKKTAKNFGRQKLDFVIVGHDGRDRLGTPTPNYNPITPDPRAVVPVGN